MIEVSLAMGCEYKKCYNKGNNYTHASETPPEGTRKYFVNISNHSLSVFLKDVTISKLLSILSWHSLWSPSKLMRHLFNCSILINYHAIISHVVLDIVMPAIDCAIGILQLR